MNSKKKKTTKRRPQKRTRRTRTRLKRAALEVFSTKPVDAATVEEITEQARVAKGTLYQHFEDKNEIVATLVTESIDHLVQRIRPCGAATGDIYTLLESVLDAHWDFYKDSREEFLLLFQGKFLLKIRGDIADDIEEPYLTYLKEIEDLLRKCLPPRTPKQDLRRFACAVAGFIFGFFSFAMIGMTPGQVEKSVPALKGAFVRSLGTFLECR